VTDPETSVGCAPLADVPCLAQLPQLIRLKYLSTINRWTTLSGNAGLLAEATGGDLSRSTLWRDLLRHYAVSDIASSVYRDRFGCWGFLDLWRDEARAPFGAADAEFIEAVAAPLTTALRRCQARTFTEPASPRQPGIGPVVLTLDDDLRITSRTATSQAWLDLLLPPRPDERAVPASVYNVAAQLLAAEAGVDSHPASSRVHLAGGERPHDRPARLDCSDARQPFAAATGRRYLALRWEKRSP